MTDKLLTDDEIAGIEARKDFCDTSNDTDELLSHIRALGEKHKAELEFYTKAHDSAAGHAATLKASLDTVTREAERIESWAVHCYERAVAGGQMIGDSQIAATLKERVEARHRAKRQAEGQNDN